MDCRVYGGPYTMVWILLVVTASLLSAVRCDSMSLTSCLFPAGILRKEIPSLQCNSSTKPWIEVVRAYMGKSTRPEICDHAITTKSDCIQEQTRWTAELSRLCNRKSICLLDLEYDNLTTCGALYQGNPVYIHAQYNCLPNRHMTGAMIGVVGILLTVIILAVILCFTYTRRKKSKQDSDRSRLTVANYTSKHHTIDGPRQSVDSSIDQPTASHSRYKPSGQQSGHRSKAAGPIRKSKTVHRPIDEAFYEVPDGSTGHTSMPLTHLASVHSATGTHFVPDPYAPQETELAVAPTKPQSQVVSVPTAVTEVLSEHNRDSVNSGYEVPRDLRPAPVTTVVMISAEPTPQYSEVEVGSMQNTMSVVPVDVPGTPASFDPASNAISNPLYHENSLTKTSHDRSSTVSNDSKGKNYDTSIPQVDRERDVPEYAMVGIRTRPPRKKKKVPTATLR